MHQHHYLGERTTATQVAAESDVTDILVHVDGDSLMHQDCSLNGVITLNECQTIGAGCRGSIAQCVVRSNSRSLSSRQSSNPYPQSGKIKPNVSSNLALLKVDFFLAAALGKDSHHWVSRESASGGG